MNWELCVYTQARREKILHFRVSIYSFRFPISPNPKDKKLNVELNSCEILLYPFSLLSHHKRKAGMYIIITAIDGLLYFSLSR